MEKFNKLKHAGLSKYSRDPEIVKNRPNKSLLVVNTIRPELLLQPSVAFPDEVKYLVMNCDDMGSSLEKSNDDINVAHLDPYFVGGWDKRFTWDLCKDLVNFNNVEYMHAYGLRLDMKLWVEFAKRSQKLKEISFVNVMVEIDWFEFNEEALEAIFKIPTLEKFHTTFLDIPILPKGPSNIIDLSLNPGEEGETDKFIESFFKNLDTHKNLKKVFALCLNHINSPEQLLQISKSRNLEELDIMIDCKETGIIQAFETLLELPKLKKLSFSFDTDRLVDNRSLIFPNIEYLDMFGCKGLSDDSVRSIFKQCPNLKSCVKDGRELFIKS